jgi:aminoglycoside phosphotransferase (APT) family kinase protein
MEMEPHLPGEHDWPQQLRTWIEATYGAVHAVERLAGMSLSGVWRVRFTTTSAIVKSSPSAHEAAFYEGVAPTLRAAGVPIPDLYLSLHEAERHWLVIEDIPTPLPVADPAGWKPDERIVAILARLHATTRAQLPDLAALERHHWSPEATAAALSFLRPNDATTLAPILERLQRERDANSDPWCWISGDPNPRNWGLRDDGTPVLFDWELFGPGTPATDLAIIVPGIGTTTDYANVAAAYLTAVEAAPGWDIEQLSRQIAVAKVATVVQLLHGHVAGTAQVDSDLLNWLRAGVPAWIRTIAAG